MNKIVQAYKIVGIEQGRMVSVYVSRQSTWLQRAYQIDEKTVGYCDTPLFCYSDCYIAISRAKEFKSMWQHLFVLEGDCEVSSIPWRYFTSYERNKYTLEELKKHVYDYEYPDPYQILVDWFIPRRIMEKI